MRHKHLLVRDMDKKQNGTPVGIRTPNLLVRSQTLYPIELRARIQRHLDDELL